MNRRHRLRRVPSSRWLMVISAAALTVFLVVSVVWAQLGQQQAQDETGAVAQQRDAVAEQRDAAAAQAQQAVDPVLELCAQGGDVAQALRDRGACDLAKQVADTPVPTQPAIPGPTGEPGRPPTAAEIQVAVDAYLLAHPPPAGRSPNAAEVAAAVASYLSANPPTPGRAPTAEEISAAVAQYFADNPVRDGQDGQDGATGEPGRPPTDAEIRSAVDSYLAANPPPQGPKGDAGPAGPPPDSLTLTIDGVEQTCTRDPGSSDESPTYTCDGPPGGGPDEPTPSTEPAAPTTGP